jgi:hypothetical protein
MVARTRLIITCIHNLPVLFNVWIAWFTSTSLINSSLFAIKKEAHCEKQFSIIWKCVEEILLGFASTDAQAEGK